MRSTRNPIRLLAIATLCLALNGCQSEGERVYPITGKISFSDGAAATFGTIECRSDSTDPVIARGRIEKDGSFTVKSFGNRNGLIAGGHRMIIVQVTGSPRDGGSIIHHHGQEVATRYSSYDSTDLRMHVEPGSQNQFEFKVDAR